MSQKAQKEQERAKQKQFNITKENIRSFSLEMNNHSFYPLNLTQKSVFIFKYF